MLLLKSLTDREMGPQGLQGYMIRMAACVTSFWPLEILVLHSLAPRDNETISSRPPDGPASFQKHSFCRGKHKAPWM